MITARPRHVLIFAAKFVVIAPICMLIWWNVIPQYAWVIGQITGMCITLFGRMPIEAMKIVVEESGVLNSDTSMVLTYQDRTFPIHIASFINNLPPFIVLVLASPKVGWKRAVKALAIGVSILAAGHVFFLSMAFVFARRIQEAPEIPTAFGLFLMTLPFMLWIVLVYWEQVTDYFAAMDSGEEPSSPNA